VVSYLSWFFLVAVEHPTGVGGISSIRDLPHVALYAAWMFCAGLGGALPWVGLGAIPLLAVVVWFFGTVRRGMAHAAPAYALVIGSIVFAALTTFSRVGFGLGGASAQRYAYVILVLLLPAIGILLSRVANRRMALFATTMVVLAGLIAFNSTTLVIAAGAQAKIEQASKARVLGALGTEVLHPEETQLLSVPPDAKWSPDALGSDLLELHHDGELPLQSR
jgi:hypothetical protein